MGSSLAKKFTSENEPPGLASYRLGHEELKNSLPRGRPINLASPFSNVSLSLSNISFPSLGAYSWPRLAQR
jgi:hypothetical protein